jgi:hypothetical protein
MIGAGQRAAGGPRGRAPPPAHRKTGGGGLIMNTPSDFFLAGVGLHRKANTHVSAGVKLTHVPFEI